MGQRHGRTEKRGWCGGRELAARQAKDTRDRCTERQMDTELVRPDTLKHGHGDRKNMTEA